jgi:hypothetical protein
MIEQQSVLWPVKLLVVAEDVVLPSQEVEFLGL